MSNIDQAEKVLNRNLLLVVQWTTAGVFGLEQVYVCEFNFHLLSSVSVFVLTRALFADNEIHELFLLNSRTQRVSGKNNLPKRHGVGTP